MSALSGCSLLIDTGDAGAESRIYIDAGADASIIDAGYIPPDASSDDVRAADATPPVGEDGGPADARVADARPLGDIVIVACEDHDEDGFGEGCAHGDDCDDSDPDVRPGATEVCNEVDDDCDGVIDEGLLFGPRCHDGEGACRADGVLRCVNGEQVCTARAGAAQPETCNGVDDDCDGVVDDGAECGWGDVCLDGGCRARPLCDGAAFLAAATPGQHTPVDTSHMESDYEGSCGGAGAPERVVAFNLDHAASVHFATFNSTFDPMLYVRATCDVPATEVGCNVDFGEGQEAFIAVDLAPGRYYVFVDGEPGEAGALDLFTAIYD